MGDRLMKRLILLMIGSTLTLTATYAGQSAEDWYRNVYAVLWKENPWNNTDAIAAAYAEPYVVHNSEGDSDTYSPSEQMAANIDEWRNDGWYGSNLVALVVDELNAGTVVFKAKWHDFYEGGSEAFECGWYLARKSGDSWKITEYAGLDCDAHGL